MVNSAYVFQAIDDTDDQFVNGLLYAGKKSDLAHDIRYDIEWSSASLTFSFPSNAKYYMEDSAGRLLSKYDGPTGVIISNNTFLAYNDYQQQAVVRALGIYSSVSNLTFTLQAETDKNHANIRFGFTSGDDPAFQDNVCGVSGGVKEGKAVSDIWIPKGGWTQFDTCDWSSGSGAFENILHEIGHSVGLKHPSDDKGFGPLPEQHRFLDYTLMSYGKNVNGDFPQSLMMDDIQAVQQLYGANFQFHAGDTVYKWDPDLGTETVTENNLSESIKPLNNKVFTTIWDGGGVDTYDFSDYAVNLNIDLRPGNWTHLSTEQLASELDTEKNTGEPLRVADGNIGNAHLYKGMTASLIENAIGGKADDYLIGNEADNKLEGRGGNDTLDGGVGADKLIGGDGDDVYYVDNKGDVIKEEDNCGYDIVHSVSDYELSKNVERLELGARYESDAVYHTVTYEGAGSIVGTGNDLDNTITGDEFYSLKGYKLSGLGGNDSLSGGGYADTLDGGVGADYMMGGNGDDVYYVDDGGDLVIETDVAPDITGGNDTVVSSIDYTLADCVENLTLDGGAHKGEGNYLSNHIIGNALDNSLYGYWGNDTLDGGAGADTLVGGGDDDTYILYNAEDTIIENFGEGTDTGNASFNYTLAANLENLTLTGSAQSGTGNSLNNVIRGNGLGDTLDGGDGNDIIYGGGGTDSLIGGSGDDFLYGLDGVDTLIGGAGNDSLKGGAGADSMEGGLGDDSYWAADVNDVIVEKAGEGCDTVYASLNYVLGSNLENLTLWGTAEKGEGNELNNYIKGNTYNNILSGLLGNDTLDGAEGADTMAGGVGDDTYYVDNIGDVVVEASAAGYDTVYSTIDYTLSKNVERLILTGSAITGTGNDLSNVIIGNDANNKLYGGLGDDTLDGGAGDDTLDGGFGVDSMTGGVGDDTYYVDNLKDLITEGKAAGTDLVIASCDHILSANVENLILSLSGTSHKGTGNDLDNKITGNNLGDTLDGGAGNDTLTGGDGKDSLIGGIGNDSLDGGRNADTLDGGAGDDILIGGIGNDILNGGENNDSLDGGGNDDTLYGGAGKDVMSGGGGKDTFVFRNVSESTSAARDTITDFTSGLDKMDLSAIDANTNINAGGDQAFNFIGASSFHKIAGELNYVNGVLSGDTNGDGLADFQVLISNKAALSASDFIL